MSNSKAEKSHTTEINEFKKSLASYTSFNDAYGILDEEKYVVEDGGADAGAGQDDTIIGVWEDHDGAADDDDSSRPAAAGASRRDSRGQGSSDFWGGDDEEAEGEWDQEDGANHVVGQKRRARPTGPLTKRRLSDTVAAKSQQRHMQALGGVAAEEKENEQKRPQAIEDANSEASMEKKKQEKMEAFATRLRAEVEKVPTPKDRHKKLEVVKKMLAKRKESLFSAIGLTDEILAELVSSLEKDFGLKAVTAAAHAATLEALANSETLPDSIEAWTEAQARLFGHLPKLPPNWIRIKSRKKNAIYFYHMVSGESTGKMPQPEASPGASPTSSP